MSFGYGCRCDCDRGLQASGHSVPPSGLRRRSGRPRAIPRAANFLVFCVCIRGPLRRLFPASMLHLCHTASPRVASIVSSMLAIAVAGLCFPRPLCGVQFWGTRMRRTVSERADEEWMAGRVVGWPLGGTGTLGAKLARGRWGEAGAVSAKKFPGSNLVKVR